MNQRTEQTQPEKTFRAVFFSPATIWLAPNDLVLFQLRNAFQPGDRAGLAAAFQPRLLSFSTLEGLLAAELSPPEVDGLERRFILNGLARELAETLEIAGAGPSMLGELADSLGDGLDRLKLAGIGWEKLGGLKPERLAQTLAKLGRAHDESLAKLGRADRFSKRQLILKLLSDGFQFRGLEGVQTINCHWSQRLSPFETDLLIALSRHYTVDIVFNIPGWVRNEDLAHGSGFDIVRTVREMEKQIDSGRLFLEFSDVAEKPMPPPALSYAAETLLAPPGYRLSNPPDPTACLSISRAPSAYQEVEEAARRLKELVARGASQAHDLALVVPDLNSYGPLIDDVGRRFGLAFHFRRGESLIEQGPARALMDLLSLWSSHWERPRVLKVLTCPYYSKLTGRTAGELHRLSLHGGVTDRRAGGGFENLQKLRHSKNEQEKDLANELLKLVKRLKEYGQTLAAQENWPDFFKAFKGILNAMGWPGKPIPTPQPSFPRKRESIASELGVCRSPGSLAMDSRFRGNDETKDETAMADLAAAFAVREELEALEEALRSPYAPEANLENFRLWLRRVLEERHLNYDQNPEGRVWALNYYDIHGAVFDEIFFLGLNERLFPQTGPSGRWWPEEFIRATAELSFLGRPLWSDVDDRYRQEELMLATGLGQARRRAHLFYHLRGEDGRAALPSPLLGQLKELWPGGLAERESSSSMALPPERVRGEDELWSALIQTEPAAWPEQLRNGPRERQWQAIRRCRAAWRQTRKKARPGEQAMAQWLTQLERRDGRPILRPEFLKSFADCPLAFWWGQTMGLSGDDAPVEEWSRGDEGTLLHRVLEKFLRPRLGPDGRPGPAWPGAEVFEKCRSELLGLLAAEIKFSQGRTALGRWPLWEARVKKLPDILSQWLRREFSRPPVRPWKVEWSFGTGELEDAPPLELPLGNGDSIYFKGRVDRLDDTEDGLAVRDYKSRESSAYTLKSANGQVEDMPSAAWPLAVYTLAASAHLGRPANGFYEFLKAGPESAGQSPLIGTDSPAMSIMATGAAPEETFNLPEHLRGLWGQVIGGVYEASGEGCDWCAFTALCPLGDKNEDEGEE